VPWAIWITNSFLQWGLLTLILWKNAWRQHAAFTTYIAFCSCKTTALIWIALFIPAKYFTINWTARIVTLPLLIAVLVQIFSAVFKPYSTLPKGTLLSFRLAFASVLAISVAAAVYYPGKAPGNLANTVLMLNRSASIIFSGAFAVTALFSSYFGIPWPRRTYGIGVGFLLFMSVDLFVSSVSLMYGYAMGVTLTKISMLSYSLALITWLIYFSKPDVPSPTLTLEQVKRLQNALNSKTSESESTPATL
jgi:hypothetical protein